MTTKNIATGGIDVANEERLIPWVRSELAKKLARQGFRPTEIARALRVTQPAVTQYLNGRRGAAIQNVPNIDSLVDPLAEKLATKIRSGFRVETSELLETARQILVMNSGRTFASQGMMGVENRETLDLLQGRLRLELDAAEKYLELANRTSDDYTKLLLRMIAADSIRHGDVVSQLISWLEAGGKSKGSIPDEALLTNMLAIEDSANESSLTESVKIGHPVARLLLRWIDMDEAKHERMVRGLTTLNAGLRKPPRDENAKGVRR